MFTPFCALKYALLVSALALPLHAAELVTLRSGFTVTCTAREALSTDMMRLHLASDSNDTQSYMDVPAASITAVETTPDIVISPKLLELPSSGTSTAALLQQSGAVHNINVALLASVVQAESAGNPHAVSHAGAAGLMQLMPGTSVQYQLKDRFSPEGNVNAGSSYLSDLLTRYHENLALALAAYNAGPAAVDRYHGIPPFRETQMYVARVIREFNRRVLVAQRASR